MNRWWIVARREFHSRALSPVNWIITVVLMLLVALGATMGTSFLSGMNDDDSSWQLADDATTQEVAQELEISAPAPTDEEADGVVSFEYETDGVLTVQVTDSVPAEVLFAIERAQALADGRELAAEAGSDFMPTAVEVEVIASSGDDLETYIAVVAIVALIFGFVMLSATALATGLVEEKSTNVVEILAPYVPARHLLLGKIIAIGAFTFLQAAVLAATAVIALMLDGAGELPDSSVLAILGSGLVWLAIAYFSFGSLFAVAASCVSSQEDAGALLNPLGIGLFVPLYVATFVSIPDPDSTATTVFSYVPLFAPFVMPVRQAYTDVSVLEVISSGVIGIVVALFLLRLAAGAYERTLLRRGRRLSVRVALGMDPKPAK